MTYVQFIIYNSTQLCEILCL